jgi:hypothetical protein
MSSAAESLSQSTDNQPSPNRSLDTSERFSVSPSHIMPAETPQPVSKTELQQIVRREFLRRPWIVRCTIIALGVLISTFILHKILSGHISFAAYLFILTTVSLFGSITGTVGFFIAPRFIRTRLPLLWGAALVNTIFFLVFGCRAFVLFYNHNN